MSRHRRLVLGGAGALALIVGVGVALASFANLQEFPNGNTFVTFTPNQLYNSFYDNCRSGQPWQIEFVNFYKSASKLGRAVAQTPGGSWLASNNDSNSTTSANVGVQYWTTQKRGFVQNSSTSTYTGHGEINGDNGGGSICLAPAPLKPTSDSPRGSARLTSSAITASPSTPQPQAFSRPATPADALPSDSLAGDLSLGLAGADSRRVASLSTASGTVSLYVARSTRGMTCLDVYAPGRSGGGGCQPSSDVYAGHTAFWTTSIEGGPSSRSLTSYKVGGVSAPTVASLAIIDSHGASHPVSITSDHGFLFASPLTDLSTGVLPTTLVTYSADGKQLEQIALR